MEKFTYDLQLIPLQGYEANAMRFLNDYDLVNVFIAGESNEALLKPTGERVCRFCSKDATQTTFNTRAHLISRLLGNDALFSDHECDACNQYFQSFEDQLANYLSVYRSISGSPTTEPTPGFVAPGHGLQIRSQVVGEKPITILRRDNPEDGQLHFNKETRKITWSFTGHSYRPLAVYKSLLKMALSILDASVVSKEYGEALDFLMSRNNGILTGCVVSGYVFPLTFRFLPQVYLFKKINPSRETHTHVLVLYAHCYMLCFPVPLCVADLFFYQPNKTISINLAPPMVLHPQQRNIAVKGFIEDFSSDLKVKGTVNQLILEMSPEHLKRSAVYNPKENQFTDTAFDPGQIQQIVLNPSGGGMDAQTLQASVKRTN